MLYIYTHIYLFICLWLWVFVADFSGFGDMGLLVVTSLILERGLWSVPSLSSQVGLVVFGPGSSAGLSGCGVPIQLLHGIGVCLLGSNLNQYLCINGRIPGLGSTFVSLTGLFHAKASKLYY